MKRKFVKVMFFGALALSTVTYVGCKDYDDDIDNLQTQIDAVKVSLEELQAKVNSGSVITNVVKGDNGITVMLSDGKSYELTNGTNGTNGKDADVWTINNEDGFWYKNDVKTKFKAVGVDGTNGTNGSNGTNGTDGKYYVPNKETGKFDIYQDGKFIEETDISWKAAFEGGMTAILDGNILTLYGVEGQEEGVPINIASGIALSSIAFIPDVVSTDVPYATTAMPFYHIKNYLDEAKYNASTGSFNVLSDWGKSNVVAMSYRLNPKDAFVGENTVFGFIDRKIKTRAAGDNKVLLNVDEMKVADGVAVIGATINPNALAQDQEKNIAALQAWYGQNPMTSDYVYATSEEIDLVLADSVKTTAGDDVATTFYSRTQSIKKNGGESSDFIKQFVKLSDAVNATFKYTSTINLKDYVGLYSDDKNDWLAELGFKGMSYEFSIPQNYLAADDEKTNQQWFIVKDPSKNGANSLENGVIMVNPEVKNGTPAIGRTPVVRVDAFLTSNNGAKTLVASSYIKLQITETETAPDVKPDPIKDVISAPKSADYHSLEDGTKAFTNGYAMDNANMGYQDINNKIYGAAKLTSTTFWNYYGGDENEYTVLVTVTSKNGQEETIIEESAKQSTDVVKNDKGVLLNINLNSENTQTASIKVGINDQIKTQNTYKDVDGKGAKYTVKITIPADDYSHKDVILEQVFYVKEECKAYKHNENYYFEEYNGHENCIVVKGQIAGGHWVMSSRVAEHFELRAGQNIFEYYNSVNNTKAISFEWADANGVTPAGPFSTNEELKLSAAMTVPEIEKQMNYKVTLNNDETCNFSYNVVFVNPFVAGGASLVTINGNAIGKNTGATMPQVLVNDNSKPANKIYSYVDGKLALSDVAKNTYKLTEDIVNATFEPVKDEVWNQFTSQLTSGSTLSVNKTTGEVVWQNEGTVLAKDLDFKVKATVTFTDLSVVSCYIKVKLAR